MSNDIEGKYKPLKIDEFNKRFQAIVDLWEEFLKSENSLGIKYHIHKPNLFEVIRRQDERKYYFKVFHDLDVPCEYKYVAIECFWINTLKPFMVCDPESSIYMCPNEMFSLYLIISTVRAIYGKYNPKKKFNYPSKERLKDVLYDFKYCNMSREAMISFVETFADNYGIGIEYLLDNCVKKVELPPKISDIWS